MRNERHPRRRCAVRIAASVLVLALVVVVVASRSAHGRRADDEDAPRPWARLLESAETREDALYQLGYGEHEGVHLSAAARTALAKLTGSANWDHRRRAVLALGKAGAGEHAEALVARIRDEEHLVQDVATLEAVPALGADALPALRARLGIAKEPAERVRLFAAAILGGAAEDEVVAELDRELTRIDPAADRRGDLTRVAHRALAAAGSWRAAEAVLRRVELHEWSSGALLILATVADERADEALRGYLESDDAATRGVAVMALASRATPPAADVFLPLARDDAAPHVRTAAFDALAKLGAVDAAPVIADGLLADDPAMVTAAARALIALGAPARPAVVKTLSPRRPRLVGKLELVAPGGSVSLGDSWNMLRDARVAAVLAAAPGGLRDARVAAGHFALVRRRGSHVWTIVVIPVASAKRVAAIDGGVTLAELAGSGKGDAALEADALVAFLLPLHEHGLVAWSADAPADGRRAPFDPATIAGAGDATPGDPVIVPAFWGE